MAGRAQGSEATPAMVTSKLCTAETHTSKPVREKSWLKVAANSRKPAKTAAPTETQKDKMTWHESKRRPSKRKKMKRRQNVFVTATR